MGKIYIAAPDGKQASYEKEQVFIMRDQGILR